MDDWAYCGWGASGSALPGERRSRGRQGEAIPFPLLKEQPPPLRLRRRPCPCLCLCLACWYLRLERCLRARGRWVCGAPGSQARGECGRGAGAHRGGGGSSSRGTGGTLPQMPGTPTAHPQHTRRTPASPNSTAQHIRVHGAPSLTQLRHFGEKGYLVPAQLAGTVTARGHGEVARGEGP